MQFLDLARIAAIAALAAGVAAHAQTTPVQPDTAIAASATGALTVTFTGIEAKKGSIMLALYDEAGWAGGKAVRQAMLDASMGEASVSIADLPAGRYGVKAFHDIDGNGQMDSNPFGMPTEPFAFSNNARGKMGPAKWDDAAFTVQAGDNAQSIVIR